MITSASSEAGAPTSPLVSMGFNFSIPDEELRETVDAWTRYIDRISKDCIHDPQLKPYILWTLLRRGIAYSVLKEWDAALVDFNRVIAEACNVEEVRAARIMSGAIYTEQCRDQDAIAYYSAVLAEYEQASREEARPHSTLFSQLYLYRGMLYGRLEQYSQAIADCDHAHMYAQNNAEVYSVRGISYGYLGNLEQALSDCLRAIELEQRTSCYTRLGEVYLMRHEYRQSLAAFERAVELNPTDVVARQNRHRALCYAMIRVSNQDGKKQEDEANSNTDGTRAEQLETEVDEA